MKLFTAVRHRGFSFNQIDDGTMSRIRYQKVAEETGEEVPEEQIMRGAAISKDRYVIVDREELAPFVPLATRSIDLEEFVERADIDPVYFETSYHVVPRGNPKPYARSPGRWRGPEGGDRPLRDAQPRVHCGVAAGRWSAGAVDVGVRR